MSRHSFASPKFHSEKPVAPPAREDIQSSRREGGNIPPLITDLRPSDSLLLIRKSFGYGFASQMASLVSKRAIVLKPEDVAQLVFFLRGEKVMFDADLAMLYGVEVRSLNQAVARNRKRFPADFAFQLTDDELAGLRSQFVISKSQTSQASSRLRSQIVTANTGRGGRRYLPYAFTEQGVAMLSSVLRSARAVEVNIAIMRTFVQLRRLMDSNRDLARKIEALEEKYDEQFAVVFEAIKQLITPPPEPPRRIGFHPS